MKGAKILTAALLAGVMLAVSTNAPVLAWEPKGVIKKYVQNQTTNSMRADADTAAEAVKVKPGDILKYTIEIRNDGDTDNGAENDMHSTILTDVLPLGVELISNPMQRQISENIGVIPAGEAVTKDYLVKVTSTKNGDLIDNKACFTGDSEPGDSPQEGCDTAKVNVTTPSDPPKPEPPKPQPPAPQTSPVTTSKQQPQQPQALPKAGAPTPIMPVLSAIIAGYTGHLLASRYYANRSE